jgi:hypothetical protein
MSAILDKLKIKNPPKAKKDILIDIGKPEYLEKEAQTMLDEESKVDTTTVVTATDKDADEVEEKKQAPLTIIDKTHVGFDRGQFREKMRARGLIVPGEVKPKTQTESPIPMPVSKPVLDADIEEDVAKETQFAEQPEPKPDVEKEEPTKPKRKPRKAVKKLRGKKIKLVGESTITKGSITATVAEKPKRVVRKPDLSIIDEAPETMVEYKELGDLKTRVPKEEKTQIIAPSYYMNNREKFVEFINKIFYPYKQEVDASSEDGEELSCDNRTEGDFDIMTHQKIVRDYLDIHSPYRGLLLYHGLGSGKTCSSIAIAEGLKDDKQIIVMTPASLRANYISQLKFCGDLMYKKNQFWEFVSLTKESDSESLAKALSELLHLPEKYIKAKGGAWFVNVKKDSNYEKLSTEERKSLDEQLNEMIRVKYKFINYNGLRQSHVDALSADGTINPFDNKVVIIDEAHNFISRIVNKLKRSDSISMRLYEFLLKANNCKVVLLTGTPIINYPNEIGIMFNILRGYIKSWTIPLNVKTGRKVTQDSLKAMFRKYAFLDYLEYSPSSKKLVVTKNPFGFINRISKTGEYNGVKLDSRGQISDEDFIEFITRTLRKQDIEIIPSTIQVELKKALPDTFDSFKNYFIKPDGNLQNVNLFKRRILGLASYFRDIEELMPKYDSTKDYHVMKIPMSDYQFGIYEAARQAERKQEKDQAKRARKAAVGKDLYESSSSTYRIFSRAFCNFVFPPEMKRPMPKEEETVDEILEKKLDEDVLDKKGVYEMLDNPDGRYTMDDLDKLSVAESVGKDAGYEVRIEEALQFLKDNEDDYLTPDKLQVYSPKFAQLLNNIEASDLDEVSKGLHLIYSQFRTLEGIGIMKLVLEANGYTQFRIKLNKGTNKWELNIAEEDRGKPTFALYTGTETPEEKEIIRNIFNSTWKDVPSELVTELQKASMNNHYGEIIKIIMITASGAEGINLRNVRYVHLIEPYWHPVRTDQVIGRARRICSHKDLVPAQRKIDVFMYLMTFTDKQKTSDESVELRLKDLSKLDKKTPLTSDEALFEISRIKEDINKQLLTALKETTIDCSMHSKSNAKEGLYCFSFGDVDPSLLSYKHSYENEQSDKTGDINKKTVDWNAQEFTLNGKKYMLRLKPDGKTRTNKVYDYYSFQQAKKNPAVNPQYIGKLVITKTVDGKKKVTIESDV